MKDPNKNYIEHLQSLDAPSKRRVLIGSTVIVMIGVVYIWFGYFNSIVMNNKGQLASQAEIANSAPVDIALNATGTDGSVAATSQNVPGFWAQVGSGFTGMYHSVVSDLENIGGSLGQSKQYNVTPQQ
jgi:hypothetical protein